MQVFAEWVVTPDEMKVMVGMPRYQTELAEMLGMHPVTLTQWRKHPEFQDMVAAQVRANVAATDLSEIIGNLVSIAKGESAQAVPAAREVLRWFRESRPTGKSDAGLDSLSDEELERMLHDG